MLRSTSIPATGSDRSTPFNSLRMEHRRRHSVISVLVLIILVLATNNLPTSKAQFGSSSSSSSSSCVNSLYPCLKYLNTTRNPADSCCDPLKYVVESDPQCLCQMISTQGTFQAQLLGINISQLELLPERCGQRVNPIACLKGLSGSRNSVQSSAAMNYRFPSLMMMLVFGALLIMLREL